MPRSYEVERSIEAAADVVWGLLVDATHYPNWNPSVISIDGEIRDGSSISLLAAVSPKRAFDLAVSIAEQPTAAAEAA